VLLPCCANLGRIVSSESLVTLGNWAGSGSCKATTVSWGLILIWRNLVFQHRCPCSSLLGVFPPYSPRLGVDPGSFPRVLQGLEPRRLCLDAAMPWKSSLSF
jgi:hypothetical protein